MSKYEYNSFSFEDYFLRVRNSTFLIKLRDPQVNINKKNYLLLYKIEKGEFFKRELFFRIMRKTFSMLFELEFSIRNIQFLVKRSFLEFYTNPVLETLSLLLVPKHTFYLFY